MIIGIDPGISGAIAAVSDGGVLLWVQDMPVRDAGKKARKQREIDGAELARILRPHVADICCAWVEEVSAMPGQGVSSMFSLGDSRGTIRGVLEALGISVERVAPQRWKRAYGLDSDKEAARALAIRLYPTRSGELARKRDHGRAEAVLIARYGAQQQRAAENFLGEAA
jgi:crossover junction endodeoxyribonuclease RuvC